jgi:hypothetical protein
MVLAIKVLDPFLMFVAEMRYNVVFTIIVQVIDKWVLGYDLIQNIDV